MFSSRNLVFRVFFPPFTTQYLCCCFRQGRTIFNDIFHFIRFDFQICTLCTEQNGKGKAGKAESERTSKRMPLDGVVLHVNGTWNTCLVGAWYSPVLFPVSTILWLGCRNTHTHIPVQPYLSHSLLVGGVWNILFHYTGAQSVSGAFSRNLAVLLHWELFLNSMLVSFACVCECVQWWRRRWPMCFGNVSRTIIIHQTLVSQRTGLNLSPIPCLAPGLFACRCPCPCPCFMSHFIHRIFNIQNETNQIAH